MVPLASTHSLVALSDTQTIDHTNHIWTSDYICNVFVFNPLTGAAPIFVIHGHVRLTLRNFIIVYCMPFLSTSADRGKVVESHGIFFVAEKFRLPSATSCWMFDMYFSINDCTFDTGEGIEEA